VREAPSLVCVKATHCSCGSGRSFGRCHGDPRNEFARTQALAEARQVALLFPSGRLRVPEALALAERLARALAVSGTRVAVAAAVRLVVRRGWDLDTRAWRLYA